MIHLLWVALAIVVIGSVIIVCKALQRWDNKLTRQTKEATAANSVLSLHQKKIWLTVALEWLLARYTEEASTCEYEEKVLRKLRLLATEIIKVDQQLRERDPEYRFHEANNRDRKFASRIFAKTQLELVDLIGDMEIEAKWFQPREHY